MSKKRAADEKAKVWAGRMTGSTSPLMEAFSRSIATDSALWPDDIAVNRAWAAELHALGVLDDAEFGEVGRGLDTIGEEFASDAFVFLDSDEDIHVAIERRLTELAGDAGARIHTGRSRNDQVATDARLYLKRHVMRWIGALRDCQQVLHELAARHAADPLPGYTHLQQAQPIVFGHFLLAIFWGADRTLQQLEDYWDRLDVLPLGTGALAGSAFPVDRARLARALGFKQVAPNSIDATGNRDFFSELLFILANFSTLLSRACAELQLWNSTEYGYVEFSDGYATGSSMMPQKKNPDAMELVRGKSAAAIAAAGQLLVLQKGLPLTYNRDLQEDKAATFHQLAEVTLATRVFSESMRTATFRTERMRESISDLTLATDLADALVRRGVPFRKAHALAAEAVRTAIDANSGLLELPLSVFRKISDVIDADLLAEVGVEESLARRDLAGGTGPGAVRAQLKLAAERLKTYEDRWGDSTSG